MSGQVRVIIATASDDVKNGQGRTTDRGQQRRKNFVENLAGARHVFHGATPAGEFMRFAAVPRMHHDQRGVSGGEFDVDVAPAAEIFGRDRQRRVGVEVLVELRAKMHVNQRSEYVFCDPGRARPPAKPVCGSMGGEIRLGRRPRPTLE